jgi:hypothetical protein
MITYITLSSDKKYLNIDVDTVTALKIQLEGDVIISKYDNKIEYRITGTNCKIIIVKDIAYSNNYCVIGQVEIHSDSISFIDRYEDYAEYEGADINTLLTKAIDLYKQEGLII